MGIQLLHQCEDCGEYYSRIIYPYYCPHCECEYPHYEDYREEYEEYDDYREEDYDEKMMRKIPI